uniref:RNA-directed DNA polymerase n=1 Tax=Culicoides sonorensis TaxID=179676 RepID=A0A336MSQ0_CULSO
MPRCLMAKKWKAYPWPDRNEEPSTSTAVANQQSQQQQQQQQQQVTVTTTPAVASEVVIEEEEEIDVVGDTGTNSNANNSNNSKNGVTQSTGWGPSSPTAGATAPSPPPHSPEATRGSTIMYNGLLRDEFRQIWSVIDKPACKLLFFVEDKILISNDVELEKIISSFHENPVGAHRGITNTYLAVKDRYFCPNLLSKIKRYIGACVSCQKIKGHKKVKQTMTLTGSPPYPFHTISYDFFGPLVSSDSVPSYTSILTITCLFSRFLILVPTVDQSAETVAKALLDNVILTYGVIPEVVLSDCAANFKSKMIAQVMKLLKIRKIHSLPYSPWINGICEKKNLQIKYFLHTTYLETGKKTNWPDSIKFVSYSYNCTTNSSTGFSPFQLIFGRKYRDLCDLHVRQLPYAKTYGDYLTELHNNIKLMQENARENILEALKKSKSNYDKNAKDMILRLGDLVLMKLPNADKLGKFEPKYVGPFEVVSSTDKTANIKQGKKVKTVH